MKLSLIVAMSRNRVIGKDNALPWHLSEDLKRFRRLTTGHVVIMGRKTHESIGRLLPQRTNIVLTRRKNYQPVEGALVYGSLDDALAALGDSRDQTSEVFIIGGAELYRQALARADRIYLTLIDRDYEGDAFFPEIPPGDFVQVEATAYNNPVPHQFIVLDRLRRPGNPGG